MLTVRGKYIFEGRERIFSKLHVQCGAQGRTQSHDLEIGTWAKISSRMMLTQLSHPAPMGKNIFTVMSPSSILGSVVVNRALLQILKVEAILLTHCQPEKPQFFSQSSDLFQSSIKLSSWLLTYRKAW